MFQASLVAARNCVCFGFMIFAATYVTGASITHGVENPNLRKRFESEYPQAARRVQDAYSRARIRATWTLPAPREGTVPLVSEVEFAGKGQLLRTVQTPQRVDPSENRSFGTRTALVANPKLSFRLTPADAGQSSEWSVASIDSLEDRQARTHMDYRGLFAPFLENDSTIEETMRQPGFEITSFETITENDKSLARIWWRARPDAVQGTVAQGWFLFDPAGSWVLRGYRFGRVAMDYPASTDTPSAQHAIHSYEGSHEGIPILKTAVFKLESPQRPKGEQTEERWDIIAIEFTEVPDEEFTLTSFGLPDLGEKRNSGALIYALLTTGICLVLLSLFVAWWSRKRGSDGARDAQK
jgi:hypothetical protein